MSPILPLPSACHLGESNSSLSGLFALLLPLAACLEYISVSLRMGQALAWMGQSECPGYKEGLHSLLWSPAQQLPPPAGPSQCEDGEGTGPWGGTFHIMK